MDHAMAVGAEYGEIRQTVGAFTFSKRDKMMAFCKVPANFPVATVKIESAHFTVQSSSLREGLQNLPPGQLPVPTDNRPEGQSSSTLNVRTVSFPRSVVSTCGDALNKSISVFFHKSFCVVWYLIKPVSILFPQLNDALASLGHSLFRAF